jgi:hypothetical protein
VTIEVYASELRKEVSMLRRFGLLAVLVMVFFAADLFAQCKQCGREGPPSYCARCDDTFHNAAGRCDFWDFENEWGAYEMCSEVGSCSGVMGEDPCKDPARLSECRPPQVTQRQWFNDEWRLASVHIVPRAKRRS